VPLQKRRGRVEGNGEKAGYEGKGSRREGRGGFCLG